MLRYKVSYPIPTSQPISAGKMNTTHAHENDTEREEIKDGLKGKDGPR